MDRTKSLSCPVPPLGPDSFDGPAEDVGCTPGAVLHRRAPEHLSQGPGLFPNVYPGSLVDLFHGRKVVAFLDEIVLDPGKSDGVLLGDLPPLRRHSPITTPVSAGQPP